MRLSLGPVAALGPNDVRVVPLERWAPPKRSLLVVGSLDGPRIYWNVCRHLPIPLDGGAAALPPGEELVCITHGAAYRRADGLCVRGPCVGAQLEAVGLEIEAGELFAIVPAP